MEAEIDDAQVLSEYGEHRSEEAFGALVRRHVDFVYATALRQVGDPGLAEEIAQDVFVLLARKARFLGRYRTLAGWLHRTTLYRVRQRLRSELRRRRREEIAADMRSQTVAGQSVWEPLVPLLDEGLEGMAEQDRLAVLLHCLEGRPFREVGHLLGVGEDAARKRVHRALERLTDYFRQQGFAVPTITAGAPLLAAGAAPATLAGSIAAAGAATVPATTALGILMTSTPVKVGLVTGLVAALAAPILLQQATIRRQTAELGSLRSARAELDEARAENARLVGSQVDSVELATLRDGYRELLQLRAEVASLKAEAAASVGAGETARTEVQAAEVHTAAQLVPRQFRAELRATLPLGSTLLTGGWMTAPGKRSVVVLTPRGFDVGGPDRQVLVTSHFVEATEEALRRLGLAYLFAELTTVSHGFVVDPAEAEALLEQFKTEEGIDILAAPRVTVLDGQQAQISSLGPGTGAWKGLVGARADFIPRLSPDGRTVELTVLAELAMVGQGDRFTVARPCPDSPI